MNKIKWTFMSLAVLLSIGGALATRPHYTCFQAPQYFFNGFGYVPAGEYGVDFFCESSPSTCCYYFDGSQYQPCRIGSYTSTILTHNKKK
jgi:hypothetical protein